MGRRGGDGVVTATQRRATFEKRASLIQERHERAKQLPPFARAMIKATMEAQTNIGVLIEQADLARLTSINLSTWSDLMNGKINELARPINRRYCEELGKLFTVTLPSFGWGKVEWATEEHWLELGGHMTYGRLARYVRENAREFPPRVHDLIQVTLTPVWRQDGSRLRIEADTILESKLDLYDKVLRILPLIESFQHGHPRLNWP